MHMVLVKRLQIFWVAILGEPLALKLMMMPLLCIPVNRVDIEQTRGRRLINRFGHWVVEMRSRGVEFVACLVVMWFGLDETLLVHVCSRCTEMGWGVAVWKAHEMSSLCSGFHLNGNDMFAEC